MALCYRNLEFFLRKMHLLSRFGNSVNIFFVLQVLLVPFVLTAALNINFHTMNNLIFKGLTLCLLKTSLFHGGRLQVIPHVGSVVVMS